MRRHKAPTLVSMWMLDVFCCALGCVTLLWLLKTREASFSADEAQAAAVSLEDTKNQLLNSDDLSNQRMLKIKSLDDELNDLRKQLALMKEERAKDAQNLALVEKELSKTKDSLALAETELKTTKQDLILARTKVEDLEKTLIGLNSKLTASDSELAKKKADLEAINKTLELAKKKVDDLDILVREKEKARAELATKAVDQETRLNAMTKSASDGEKLMARVSQLEGMLKAERAKLDDANVTIVDLQGTKAKLADKVNKLQIESDNKFAGIALTGKNVVFLVDMSGSMDRTDESTIEPTKWPIVRETICKVMRSLPNLEQFQVIMFSSKSSYLIQGGDWLAYEKEKSITQVSKALTAIKPVGDTNLYLGLEEAFKFRTKGMDTIYLISDGLPTSGPGLTALEEKTLEGSARSDALGKYLRKTLNTTWNRPDGNKNKVKINSIGFFYESPEVGAFLWSLSREHNGSFVGMSNP